MNNELMSDFKNITILRRQIYALVVALVLLPTCIIYMTIALFFLKFHIVRSTCISIPEYY